MMTSRSFHFVTSFSVLLTFLSFSLLYSATATSQAAIRESSTSEASESVVASNTPVDESLVYELQLLQSEVLSLRGQLEQQQHEIKRLKQQRLDDYLDLDKRISELVKQQSDAAAFAVQQASTVNASGDIANLGAQSATVLPNDTPQSDALYDDAINLLLNEQNYEGAQEKFSSYLDQYPKGRYVANAYYWQGQILYAGGEKEVAAETFETLISSYPDHAKVPDAKFKLARIYFDQGDKAKAKEIFDDVAASDTDAALLAKSFISKNY